MPRDRHQAIARAHLLQQRVLSAGGAEEGRAQDAVEERPRQTDAAGFLAHDGELDRAEPLTAELGGHDEAHVAHVGELPPLRRLEAVRLLLHDATPVLERRRLGEEVARRARSSCWSSESSKRMAQTWGRPSTRLAMMLRCTSDDPE